MSSQSNEESERKKRKGALKDDGKKIKKPKTDKEKEETLTLNASAKIVQILHIRVIHFPRIPIYYQETYSNVEAGATRLNNFLLDTEK